MARSKTFSELWLKLWSFTDFLYILQLEDYFSGRYFHDLERFFWRRDLQQRQKLEETSRVKVTRVVSYGFWAMGCGLLLVVLLTNRWGLVIALLGLILDFLLIPVWVGIANTLISPVQFFARERRINQAAIWVRKHPHMKVIAIAGSYGKTTTKYFLEQLTQFNYRVEATPGTVNTPLGIANWILNKVNPATNLLIIEMDTYRPMEIGESCRITPPDIAVLTSIGDQHLERFGLRSRLASSLLEVFDCAKPGAVKIMEQGDLEVLHQLRIDTAELESDSQLKLLSTDKLNYKNQQLQIAYETNAITRNLQLALAAIAELDIPANFVVDTVAKLKLPERRHETIELHGFTVIDDSYNISPTTAMAALTSAQAVAKKQGKKLIVITGGIPELGSENLEANILYGQELAARADFSVVLGTILAPQLRDAITASGKDGELIMAKDLTRAWEIIQAKFKPAEVIILQQTELNDLYY